jgi:hypothetical protein
LENKYARATEIVCKALAINTKILANFLSHNDPMYPVIRLLIHQMDVWVQIHSRNMDYETSVEYLRTRWRFIYSGEYVNRLDEIFKRAILREQGSRGAGLRSDSDEGQLPLDFS